MNKNIEIKKELNSEPDSPREISLITSCGCNLQCSYCVINKSKNSFAKELQEKTIKALKDNSFLTNVKAVFKKLNFSPGQINTLSLWGQEPTLTLCYLTPHIKDYLDYFFNIDQIEFVTNGMSGGSEIVDFIQQIDNSLDHKITIAIQFSYDGAEQTKLSRKGNSETIFNTISFIINSLNDVQFKKIKKVLFHLHGVLSIELVNRLNSMEKIKEYFDEYEHFSKKLCDLNRNPIVDVNFGPSLALESPVDATTEDGLNYAKFYKSSIKLKNIHNKKNTYAYSLDTAFRHMFNFLYEKFPYRTISQFLDGYFVNDELYKNTNQLLSMHNVCGTQNIDIKIMYDGSIISCQNSIYEREKENLKEFPIINVSDLIAVKNKETMTNPSHKWCYNVLNEPIENCLKIRDLFFNYKNNGFIFQYQQVLNLMYLLAQCHQIDESYLEDMNKLMRHAFIIAGASGCFYNNLIKTGSVVTKHAGYIRLVCNGLMDEMERIYLLYLGNNGEEERHVFTI